MRLQRLYLPSRPNTTNIAEKSNLALFLCPAGNPPRKRLPRQQFRFPLRSLEVIFKPANAGVTRGVAWLADYEALNLCFFLGRWHVVEPAGKHSLADDGECDAEKLVSGRRR